MNNIKSEEGGEDKAGESQRSKKFCEKGNRGEPQVLQHDAGIWR